MYQPIDQAKTGMKLKMMLNAAGYDVKYIQEYLHLSCPQSIYRWYKGKALPSVEHLYALSKLLKVHVEDLLVLKGEPVISIMIELSNKSAEKHLLSYVKYFERCKAIGSSVQ